MNINPQETYDITLDDKADETVDLSLEQPLKNKKVLIVVENLPVPFDRRVWHEALTLKAAGADVSIICPTGVGFTDRREELEGIHIYRHPLPLDASGALGYLVEYSCALFWEFVLTLRVYFTRGIDVIHGCNPPDLIFLVALPFKLLGVKYLFDHHDINPELYEAKYGKRGFFWKLMGIFEKLTFKVATVSIATNNSYREIAVERGNMSPDDVFVVRSGPNLSRIQRLPPNDAWKNGRQFLIGYVGVMGEQEGIDLLLESVKHIVFSLKRTDIQFCLVGGGSSLENLKSLSQEMGISEYVTFTGRAPDETLFEVLSTSDVCVNPDLVNTMNDKSTMNKIMEYMAFEKPIIQFDVVEGRFSAQEASLYAEPNNPVDMASKIIELLADPDRRKKMGEYGRQRVVNELSWSHQVKPLLEAYKRILKI
ncbi:glycosyltransferase family 4 protein [Sneathiella marina]|uniref:Glycosyltransferase family 4 protein n=1 Tax=Sneathiella marina TaxID=2950108 RepID=A0ABY4W390_9PROT|nr:glycosyltransferase family 4 protein [Sneathiella marina]USG61304.1 glycosyltransferase family 4 protein [Sneathiella marina]